MRHLVLAIALILVSACAAGLAETTHTADDEEALPPQDFGDEEPEMCLEPPPEEVAPEPCGE